MDPPVTVRTVRAILRYIDVLLNHTLLVLLAIFAGFVVGTSMDRLPPCVELIAANSSLRTRWIFM
jgi:hypothetical protein